MLGVVLALLAVRAAAAAIDLEISESLLQGSIKQGYKTVSSSDCAFHENCVSGSGERKLLLFDVAVGNHGPDDYTVGDPSGQSGFEIDTCHGHIHNDEFLAYTLLRGGVPVVETKKQGWCAEDSAPFPECESATRSSLRYTCDYQGISVCNVDIYSSEIDCQWVDITGLAPGGYTLRLEVNPARNIQETDYSNNVKEVPVSIQ